MTFSYLNAAATIPANDKLMSAFTLKRDLLGSFCDFHCYGSGPNSLLKSTTSAASTEAVTCGSHCDANIRHSKRWGIVHTISYHHDRSMPSFCEDDVNLILWLLLAFDGSNSRLLRNLGSDLRHHLRRQLYALSLRAVDILEVRLPSKDGSRTLISRATDRRSAAVDATLQEMRNAPSRGLRCARRGRNPSAVTKTLDDGRQHIIGLLFSSDFLGRAFRKENLKLRELPGAFAGKRILNTFIRAFE
jgi:hypothetical protein